MTCQRCIVTGRVQGVSFRAATRKKALQLGVNGWVRNLADGRVEVVVFESEGSNQLLDWLKEGPRLAWVTALECAVMEEADGFTGFEIR